MVENSVAARFGIGQAVRRSEDPRFLTGRGRYTDDLSLPRQAHGYLLRSPFAHAAIRSIDVEAARGMPGVLGIVTGADPAADGLCPPPCETPIRAPHGRGLDTTPPP